MWSYFSPEQRFPKGHPLRPIRAMVDHALEELSPRFALCRRTRSVCRCPRGSNSSGHLLLQAFYSVRRERQLLEQLDYNLLFRWFVGLNRDDPIRDPIVVTKNRDRLP